MTTTTPTTSADIPVPRNGTPPGTGAFLDGDKVTVRTCLSTPAILAGARRYADEHDTADVTEFLSTAAEVGAQAMTLASTTLDTAAVARAVDRATTGLEAGAKASMQLLTDAVTMATDPQHGTVARSLQGALNGLVEHITHLTAGADAPVRRAVTEALGQTTDRALAEVQRALAGQTEAVRRVLATDVAGSQLATLRTELVRVVTESHRSLAGQLTAVQSSVDLTRGAAAAEARTTLHGQNFEVDTLDVLARLTQTAGDHLSPVGTTTGLLPRCQTGDAVVALATPPGMPAAVSDVKVVVECKAARPRTVAAWSEELRLGMKNRGAQAALGILQDASAMPGRRSVVVIDRSMVLVAYDPARDTDDLLVAVWGLLRTGTLAAALEAVGGGTGDIDLAAANAALGEALAALSDVALAGKHVAAARKQLDSIDKVNGRLRTRVTDRIAAAARHLSTEEPANTSTPESDQVPGAGSDVAIGTEPPQ